MKPSAPTVPRWQELPVSFLISHSAKRLGQERAHQMDAFLAQLADQTESLRLLRESAFHSKVRSAEKTL